MALFYFLSRLFHVIFDTPFPSSSICLFLLHPSSITSLRYYGRNTVQHGVSGAPLGFPIGSTYVYVCFFLVKARIGGSRCSIITFLPRLGKGGEAGSINSVPSNLVLGFYRVYRAGTRFVEISIIYTIRIALLRGSFSLAPCLISPHARSRFVLYITPLLINSVYQIYDMSTFASAQYYILSFPSLQMPSYRA